MGWDEEGGPGVPVGQAARGLLPQEPGGGGLQPGAAGDHQPRWVLRGRRECLTRSLPPALPSGERAGVVLHALYSPHRPGESGGTLAPSPAASAASQLGARRPLRGVGSALGPRSWPCPPPGSGRRKVLGGFAGAWWLLPGSQESGAGPSAWSLGRLTAVSAALAGRGVPGFPPRRSPGSVHRDGLAPR